MHATDQTIEGLELQLQAIVDASSTDYAEVALQLAGRLLDSDLKADAHNHARPAVDTFLTHEDFENAARACQYVYLAEQEDSIPAIGQAAWLAVTYPIDPALSATILEHIVDETPDESDGAAVAAATAHFLTDLRAKDKQHEELSMFTGGLLARVARRHSEGESQEDFAAWVERMELDQPEKFLVRLRNVIDVMVQTDWWFDREALKAALPNDE